jgi:asparagine synthase (glutamine-hydrolysing)
MSLADQNLYDAFRTARVLEPGESITTTTFGGFCPYYARVDGRTLVASTFDAIAPALPADRRTVDATGFLQLLQFNHLLGQRTLVRGLQRMPWRATLTADGSLRRRPPLPHGQRTLTPAAAAATLYELLRVELQSALADAARIRVLLTGGLDSRIAAAVLRVLQREGRVTDDIEAITWGHPTSRDVIYARQIAVWLGWPHRQLAYDAELTRANIHRGALWGGSEVPGIHLHRMPWFDAHSRPGDVVLAASWGDSVGRAEYSSVRLADLTLPQPINPADILHAELVEQALEQSRADLATAWDAEPDDRRTTRCELHQQENYMRRMIGQTMDHIRGAARLEQAFTHDAVVSFMWSLDPTCRTDAIYHHLLQYLDDRLYHLPWARDGVAPSGRCDDDTALRPQYHDWFDWLDHDLQPELDALWQSQGMRSLGLLHGPVFHKRWARQTLVKLASVELTRRTYLLSACRAPTIGRDVLNDWLRRGWSRTRKTLGLAPTPMTTRRAA